MSEGLVTQSEYDVVSFPMNYDNISSLRSQSSALSPSSTPSGDDNLELSRAFKELLLACRAGDIDTVDSVLSTPYLNINQVDEWDYSPLILASLCGHTKIVELLLSRGAVCDRDTFQGARCIYGALNDTIRDLLISFDISKAVDSSQPFVSHISSLLNYSNQTATKDIAFHFRHIHGALSRDLQVFKLNRFLLAARSPYFKEKLNGVWKHKLIIDMPPSSNPEVFKIIVDYIYLRTDSLPIDQKDIQDHLCKFASKLELNDLIQGIEMVKKSQSKKDLAKTKHDLSFMLIEKARMDLNNFLKESIINQRVSSELNLIEESEYEEVNLEEYIDDDQKIKLFNSPSIPDLLVSVLDVESDSVVFYPVHKSILARSEYFDTMLKSDIFLNSHKELPVFNNATLNCDIIDYPSLVPEHLPILRLSSSSTSIEVSSIILSYLYHDDVPNIPLSSAIELLFAADEIFLDRLKTMCAVKITSYFNKLTFKEFQSLHELVGYNAYELINISWQTRCDKLEQHLSKLIAYNLADIFNDKPEREELALLVRESAERITERQDTDTIELIDDIRYYLSKKYAVSDEAKDFEPIGEQFRESDLNYIETDDIKIFKSAMIQYERDIERIEILLDELNLDA